MEQLHEGTVLHIGGGGGAGGHDGDDLLSMMLATFFSPRAKR
jgi:hypothetical protein